MSRDPIVFPDDTAAPQLDAIAAAQQTIRLKIFLVSDPDLIDAHWSRSDFDAGESPHTLKKDKRIEGVGGLRIMHDVGAPVHHLKGLRRHAKIMLADLEKPGNGGVGAADLVLDAREERHARKHAKHHQQRAH